MRSILAACQAGLTQLLSAAVFFKLLLMLLMMFPDLQVFKFFSTYFFPFVSPFCLLLVSLHLTSLKKDTVSVSGSKLLKEIRNINNKQCLQNWFK